MAWQAANPGTIAQDAQGNYHIKVGDQWTPAPKGSIAQDGQGAYHFNSDSLTPPTPPTSTAAPVTNAAVGGKETTEGPLGFANGLAELVGKGLGNIPMGAVHAIADLASRASGHGARPESTPTFPLSSNAQSVGAGVSDALSNAAKPYPGIPALEQPIKDYVQPVANDVAAVAPVAGAVRRLTGALGGTAEAAGPFGMKTGEANPIARNIAGSSARPTVAAHNQAIADPTLGAQAGVPPGTKITPQSLEAGREAPNSVYQRAETSIPTGPLSPASAQAVQGVGADDMIVHSPDTQATIDAQKARLLSGPLTGSQVVNAQKTLRFNGFKNIGSEDPEQLALGHAQLKMADALHQHMVDTLPPDAPVSADQLTAARTALAQNHTIENVLGPNGNVNLTKLAKLHNDNPGMLSGPMKDIAQFASDHPEVIRLPTDAERFNPHSVVQDIASINPLQRPVGSVAQLFGGAMARRALTGPKPSIAPPVTGLAGEFGPIERGPPQPPPGMSAAPPTAPPPPAGGPPGQIPLADLLSHGVEQQPAAGLSLASEAPAQTGLPFARNAAHEAGGLEVAPEDAWFKGGAPDLSDLGKVMSQGVPEGIVQRANNASGESAASLESIRRGTRDLAVVDSDGNEQPLLRDVTQIDQRAPKGKILIDRSNGEIIDRGGLSEGLAKGLRNRWATMGRTLGDNFTVGK